MLVTREESQCPANTGIFSRIELPALAKLVEFLDELLARQRLLPKSSRVAITMAGTLGQLFKGRTIARDEDKTMGATLQLPLDRRQNTTPGQLPDGPTAFAAVADLALVSFPTAIQSQLQVNAFPRLAERLPA